MTQDKIENQDAFVRGQTSELVVRPLFNQAGNQISKQVHNQIQDYWDPQIRYEIKNEILYQVFRCSKIY